MDKQMDLWNSFVTLWTYFTPHPPLYRKGGRGFSLFDIVCLFVCLFTFPGFLCVFPVPNWEHFRKVTEVLSRDRLSVRPSVRPSVAKRSAQTVCQILIKFGVNMHEDMGMPPLLFIFLQVKGQGHERRFTTMTPYAFRGNMLDILFDM